MERVPEMNILLTDEAIKLLGIRRLPGRLTVAQASILLGFNSIDVPGLIAKRLLRPLGKPAPNAIKYFARRTHRKKLPKSSLTLVQAAAAQIAIAEEIQSSLLLIVPNFHLIFKERIRSLNAGSPFY